MTAKKSRAARTQSESSARRARGLGPKDALNILQNLAAPNSEMDSKLFMSALGSAAELLDPSPNPYLDDPVGWVRDVLGEFLWSLQREIAEMVRDNRYVAIPSCHDSGKSYLASRLAAWWIDVHKPGEAFVVSTAPTTHQVEAILWREIERAHRKGNLPGRITLDAKWRLGTDELVGYGRKPQDYNPDAFQGIHQRYILIIIDEANGVPKILYDAVDALATNANARVLAIGNPDNPSSHFAQICKPGSGWATRRISGFETPNFTGEPVPYDLSELLLSPEWVEERKKRWGEKSPLYVSKVLAQFPDISDEYLIQPSWVEAAQKRNLPRREPKQLGADIARFGDDETVVYLNEGGHVRCVKVTHGDATTVTAGHIKNQMDRQGPAVPCIVDEVGVGGGVVDLLREQGLPVVGFIGGATPSDGEHFVNLRSEGFWKLREWFEQGVIDIDPLDEQLANELGNLKWTVDSKGRITVESKDDYRKRVRAPSPDRADGCMYAVAFPPTMDIDINAHGGPTMTSDILTKSW